MFDYPEQYVIKDTERNRKYHLKLCDNCDIPFHTKDKRTKHCSGLCKGTKYRQYSDKDIIDKAKEVKSLRGLLLALNLRAVGGNYTNMKRHLQRLDIDTSHWTGRSWCKGEQLKDWQDYTSIGALKPHLITQRGHKCESCFLSLWLNKQIILEIHHIDGDRSNNLYDNLQLLCPNCHSMTDNWRGRKSKDV